MTYTIKPTFTWPDENSTHLDNSYMRFGFLVSASTIKRWLILIVLILFALSQAGTTLFVMTKVGFSHLFALLLAFLVGVCMILVYYQRLAQQSNRERFSQPEFYKAHRDLMKSIEVLPVYKKEREQYEQIKLIWFILRSRHIIKSFRENGLSCSIKEPENAIREWVSFKMRENLGFINSLEGHAFYDNLCADHDLIQWLELVVTIEDQLIKLSSKYQLSREALQSMRACVTQIGWFFHDTLILNKEIHLEHIPTALLEQLNQLERKERSVLLGLIRSKEEQLIEKTPKSASKQFLKRFRYYRVTVDQKNNLSPEAESIPKKLSFWGGFFNMWLGNNLLGLYGSLAGVATLLVFFPVIHLSYGLKVTIALFGAGSAAFATCIMTWPLLNKLMEYLSRWRMREQYRNINKSTYLIQKRPWDARLISTVLLAVIITFVAIHFNVFATWHLTNRLSALFAGAQISALLNQITWGVKAFFALSQAVCSLLCAGSLYFYSCYQQYAGQHGKRELRWISVVDKVLRCIKEKNWKKTAFLVVIGVCSLMAAFAQTLIWFRGFGLWMQITIAAPIFMAFFATFCEAGLACLDHGSGSKRPHLDVINTWIAPYDSSPSSKSLFDSGDERPALIKGSNNGEDDPSIGESFSLRRAPNQENHIDPFSSSLLKPRANDRGSGGARVPLRTDSCSPPGF